MVIGRRNIQHDSENSLLDLRGSNLSYTRLDNGNYDFSKATFFQTLLYGIVWNNIILELAIFQQTDFTQASFQHCSFKEANLKDTTVTGVEFLDCNLQKADFRGAKKKKNQNSKPLYLSNSQIQGTNFKTCFALTQDDIEDAIGDETTKLPENLEMPKSWKNKSNKNNN